MDTRLLSKKGQDEIAKEAKEFGKNVQTITKGLPEANNDNPIIATIAKGLDMLSDITGGVIPAHGTNGGLLGNIPVILGDDDISHRVIGDPNAKKVYIPGMMQKDEQSMIDGANNLIGKNEDKQIWTNPSHGFFGDLFESATDKVGYQTGISSQIEELTNKTIGATIYMHSQGHEIAKVGAINNPNNQNTYKSHGAPTNKNKLKSIFNMPDVPNQYGNPSYVRSGNVRIEMNEGDPVSNPENLFNPNTWFKPGHSTVNYGESALQKNQKPIAGN